MGEFSISPMSEEDQPDQDKSAADSRAARRLTVLIRAAKLIAPHGEFVCVIRDVSETGVSVKLFHAMPSGDDYELQMPDGEQYRINLVWERGNEVGFEFDQPIDVEQLVNEAGNYPKRGLRLGVFFPVTISTLTQKYEAIVENLSQQGARIECEGLFAVDQGLIIGSDDFAERRAKVRWHRDQSYGVVFEDTFTLEDFARLAARLQVPGLLDD